MNKNNCLTIKRHIKRFKQKLFRTTKKDEKKTHFVDKHLGLSLLLT